MGSNLDEDLYRNFVFLLWRLLRDRDRTGTTTIAMFHRLKKGDCFEIEIEAGNEARGRLNQPSSSGFVYHLIKNINVNIVFVYMKKVEYR